jgi:hypothetical protein
MNKTMCKLSIAAIFGAFAVAASAMTPDIALATGADRSSSPQYHQELANAKAEYDQAFAACDVDQGHERRECRRDAHRNWELAKADARTHHGLDWPVGDEFK